MRKVLVVVGASIFAAALEAHAQQRQDTFDAAAVTTTEIVLHPLGDGGCEARWCGGATSQDGGVTLEACTRDVELRAAVNQNRCAALASAGVNRIARELRFEVDAGAP